MTREELLNEINKQDFSRLVSFEELSQEDKVIILELIGDNLLSKDDFPMEYKKFLTWKNLKKYNMIRL